MSKQSLSTAVRYNPTHPIDPNASEKKSRRRSSLVRSLDGCLNCRARRKKCPGSKTPDFPDDTCESCRKLRFECLGYPGQAPGWLGRDSPLGQELRADMQQWVRAGKAKGNSETLNLSKYRKLSTADGGWATTASRHASNTSSERVVGGTSSRRKSRQSEIPSELTSVFYCRPERAPSSKISPEHQPVSKAPTSASHQTSTGRVVIAPGTSFRRDPVPQQPDFDPSYDEFYAGSNSSVIPQDTLYLPPHVAHPFGSSRMSQSTISRGRTPGAGTGPLPFTTYAAASPLPAQIHSSFRNPEPGYIPSNVNGLNYYPSQYLSGSGYNFSTSYPYDNSFDPIPGTVHPIFMHMGDRADHFEHPA